MLINRALPGLKFLDRELVALARLLQRDKAAPDGRNHQRLATHDPPHCIIRRQISGENRNSVWSDHRYRSFRFFLSNHVCSVANDLFCLGEVYDPAFKDLLRRPSTFQEGIALTMMVTSALKKGRGPAPDLARQPSLELGHGVNGGPCAIASCCT